MTAYHVSQQVAATAPAASTHSQLFINVLQTLRHNISVCQRNTISQVRIDKDSEHFTLYDSSSATRTIYTAQVKLVTLRDGHAQLASYTQCESKSISNPPKTFCNFSLRLSIFPRNFANMLPVYIYTYLPILVAKSLGELLFLTHTVYGYA